MWDEFEEEEDEYFDLEFGFAESDIWESKEVPFLEGLPC